MIRLLYFKDKWTPSGVAKTLSENEFLRLVRSRTQVKETTDGFVLGSFKHQMRLNEDFIESSFIALDFDSGNRLEEIQSQFQNMWHVIYTSLSHTNDNQKFRLILKLPRPIKKEEFSSRMKVVIEKMQADKSCSNPARLWFCGKDVVSFNFSGEFYNLPENRAPERTYYSGSVAHKILSSKSKHFLQFGAPAGQWHKDRLTFLMNAYHQGFTPDEVRALFSQNHTLDRNDEFHIQDVYDRYFYKKVG